MQLRIIRGWVWSIFARLEFGAAKAGPAAVLATALAEIQVEQVKKYKHGEAEKT